MSQFQIIIPEQTTNLMLDPSFEYGDPADYWSTSATGGSSPTVALTADPWIGVYAAEFDFDGASQMILYQGVAVSAASYTLTARVKRAAGGTVSNSYARARFDSATDDWDTIEADKDGWYLCTKTDTPTSGTRNFGIVALEDGLIVDAVQLEQKAHATTYCDGDMTGNRGDGYRWNGTAHASTSTRHAQERSGGLIQDIVDDLGATSIKASGLGVPEETHHTEDLSLLPGSLYQGSKVGSRYIDLTLNFKGTSIPNLHAKRKLLRQAIKRNRVTPEQPFVFRYTGNSDPLEIDALYAGGMQQSELAKYTEKAGVRLFCPQPYWRKPGNKAAALTVQQDISDADYIIQRDRDGNWRALGSGMDARVRAIARIGERLYAGGLFTTAGGVTVNYFAVWDQIAESWADCNGGTDGEVLALAVTPDNKIVLGGTFTTAGGVTVNNIALYNPATDAYSALDSGVTLSVSGAVWAVAVGLDGTIYAAGGIDDASGTAVSNIAAYSGGTWTAMGAGVNGFVFGMAVGPVDGKLYVTGSFTEADGGVVNYVAQYDPSTGNWAGMGGGFDTSSGGRGIAAASNGDVYIVGAFDQTAGGEIVNYTAKFSGDSLSPLGSGLNANGGQSIAVAPDGSIYVGGSNFTAAGGVTVPDHIARWSNSAWVSLGGIDLPGTATVYAIHAATDGVLTLGYNTSGTATNSAITTVDYDGTADTHPKLVVTGPGQLYSLENVTTGTAIYFDLGILSGETVILDLDPQRVRFTSSFPSRGNIINKILNGSDVAAWRLQEGDNSIGLFIDDNTATAFLIWQELYEAADG